MPQFKNIKGFEELAKALDTFPEKFGRNVVRAGLRAGAKPIKEEVQRNAPVGPPSSKGAAKYGGRPGLLRDSVRIGTGYKNGVVKAIIKVGGKVKGGGDAFYPIMVEFGTAAHIIAARTGKSLYINGVFLSYVQHPGAHAKPFVRPALIGKANAALAETGNYIKGRLSKANFKDLDRLDIVVDDDTDKEVF
jgi:HK97 gp10 family phage protein